MLLYSKKIEVGRILCARVDGKDAFYDAEGRLALYSRRIKSRETHQMYRRPNEIKLNINREQ